MPFLDLASHRLHYRIDGDTHGSQSKPWLIFCNSLGTDLTMWDAQVAGLWRHFRMLRYVVAVTDCRRLHRRHTVWPTSETTCSCCSMRCK
ncbi:hypothetical protein [Rhizobium giardinii]|uniref:hypothetical protein n=1 Tax=Rhizobium giardinii TaxID=56731 RepID=UPI003D6F4925